VGIAQHPPDARGQGRKGNRSHDVSDVALNSHSVIDSAVAFQRFMDNLMSDPSALSDAEAVDEFLAMQVAECVMA
jgi:hypothetical protein